MAHKQSKAEIAGIVVFSFCLFVFVVMDAGFVYMAIHERWGFHLMMRGLLFLSVITWTADQAVRVRVKRPISKDI
jgi:hypothetical protein